MALPIPTQLPEPIRGHLGYLLAGSARVTCIDPEGRNFIDDVNVGDLWNFRAGLPHSIQAQRVGDEVI
jgi:oxalate decarboxylase